MWFLFLQKEVAGVFLPNYRRFYEKYSKIRFSKKHQNEYTKYSPYKIEELLNQLYVDPEWEIPTVKIGSMQKKYDQDMFSSFQYLN